MLETSARLLRLLSLLQIPHDWTGTMTALPFREGTFDVVTSSLAIHNIDQFSFTTHHRRLRAVDEAVRVLVPRGRLVIADLMWTGRYGQRLHTLGMDDVQRRGLGWRFWYGPGMGASLVTATKPPPVGERLAAVTRRRMQSPTG